MGLSVSWVGVKGQSKDALLGTLDLVEIGPAMVGGGAKFVCAEMPTGWIVIYAESFGYASPKRIAALSIGGAAIGCAIEEHVMFSGARAYEDGREIWSVIHDAQNGVYDLSTTGKVPDELKAIKERIVAEQESEGGKDAGVDLVFDVPLELAAAITGFKHDEPFPESGGPVLTALKPRPRSLMERLGAMLGRG